MRETEATYPLSEPVSFQVKGSRVEVATKAKDRPFLVRQSFAMDEDGWLEASAEFEAVDARSQEAAVELALPAAQFTGKSIRGGDRFLDLPAQTGPKPGSLTTGRARPWTTTSSRLGRST